MSIPSPVYADGTLTTARRVSIPVLSCPIPGDNTAYLLTEDWEKQITDGSGWTPTALNTAHGESADFFLVAESEPRDVGGGFVRWTRTYAKLPPTHYEPDRVTYNFPGFWGIWGITALSISGRDRYTRSVPARVRYDYVTADDPSACTYIEPTVYLASTASDILECDLLADNNTEGRNAMAGTVPGRTTYESWVTAGDWHIVAEGSTFERWHGKVFRRRTVYIQAE